MAKRNNLLNDKKGAAGDTLWGAGASNVHKGITSTILVIFVLLLIFSFLLAFCGSIGPFQFGFTDQPVAGQNGSNFFTPGSYEKMQDQINGPGLMKYYYKSVYWTADKLGFNTGYTEVNQYGGCWGSIWHYIESTGSFIGSLIIGLLAGFWLFLMNLLYRFFTRFSKTTMKSQWLILIGSSAWKVIAIGVGYAVLMQIPIINRAIEIITFEVLGVNFFIRSIIIAFYIGFGPAWIESYQKYRLRLNAEKAVIYAKTAAKLEKARSGG
jgi:hypothetical protein